MKVTVLGSGAWGTAAAKLLHHNGHNVSLWGHQADRVEEIHASHRNERCLPGVDLPREWTLTSNWDEAIEQCELIVLAVPSSVFRNLACRLSQYRGVMVSLTKGIEHETGLTMCGVLRTLAPDASHAALSGPSFAIEVARGVPTAIVAASRDAAVATLVQSVFHRATFRVYTSADLLGVELGGALKNVMAVAAGICDGMGFGDNSKAALITRAIAEVRRLGVACGAHADTFAGLSGLGDLTLTCFSRLSRNRAFGERLGRGEKQADVLRSMTSVVEGYPTARSAFQLARRHDVVTPIIDEVFAMLYQRKNLMQAVKDLMGRDSKAED